MLIRKELSPSGGDPEKVASLRGQIEAYRLSKHAEPLLAKLMHGEPVVAEAVAAVAAPTEAS